MTEGRPLRDRVTTSINLSTVSTRIHPLAGGFSKFYSDNLAPLCSDSLQSDAFIGRKTGIFWR